MQTSELLEKQLFDTAILLRKYLKEQYHSPEERMAAYKIITDMSVYTKRMKLRHDSVLEFLAEPYEGEITNE